MWLLSKHTEVLLTINAAVADDVVKKFSQQFSSTFMGQSFVAISLENTVTNF